MTVCVWCVCALLTNTNTNINRNAAANVCNTPPVCFGQECDAPRREKLVDVSRQMPQ